MNIIEATFSGFPNGYCPVDWDTLISDAFSYTSWDFTVTAGYYYNYSDTQPDANHRVYPWVRKYGYGVWDWDPNATPQAAWVQRHQVPASSGVRWPFEGTEADVWAFDGGDGLDPAVDVPTQYSGAMWEVDHNYDGRSPMGPGTVGSDTLAVSTAYGAAEINLTSDQLGHTHVFGNYAGGNDDARYLIGNSGTFSDTNSMEVHGDTGDPQETDITAGNLRTAKAEPESTQVAVSVVHPVRGAWMIKRTARVYYKVLP